MIERLKIIDPADVDQIIAIARFRVYLTLETIATKTKNEEASKLIREVRDKFKIFPGAKPKEITVTVAMEKASKQGI